MACRRRERGQTVVTAMSGRLWRPGRGGPARQSVCAPTAAATMTGACAVFGSAGLRAVLHAPKHSIQRAARFIVGNRRGIGRRLFRGEIRVYSPTATCCYTCGSTCKCSGGQNVNNSSIMRNIVRQKVIYRCVKFQISISY